KRLVEAKKDSLLRLLREGAGEPDIVEDLIMKLDKELDLIAREELAIEKQLAKDHKEAAGSGKGYFTSAFKARKKHIEKEEVGVSELENEETLEESEEEVLKIEPEAESKEVSDKEDQSVIKQEK
ncbi:MAG TPA: hypothetical protein PKC98_20520, partial [Candidatus Melainabacteria bacterium]|nr:hypothetical protein [Candidatus Melainabacteria bacterium]